MNVKTVLEVLKTIIADQPGAANARLAAAIVYKNKIVSVGYNQRKTHPFQADYGKNDKAIYFHAETHAIFNALKRLDKKQLAKCTLVVARLKKDGPGSNNDLFGLAKPCSGCQKCIDEHGLKRVVYTLDSTFKKMSYAVDEVFI